jgi:hypothetical protein
LSTDNTTAGVARFRHPEDGFWEATNPNVYFFMGRGTVDVPGDERWSWPSTEWSPRSVAPVRREQGRRRRSARCWVRTPPERPFGRER